MQTSILDKYLVTLYAESTFSSPEPFTPKSDLSSQSDTSPANIVEVSEMNFSENFSIPPIQIPKINTTESSLEKISVKSNTSSNSFFDWTTEQNLLDSTPMIEKKLQKILSLIFYRLY